MSSKRKRERDAELGCPKHLAARLNDTDLAQEFTRTGAGSKFVYSESKRWFAFDGCRWVEDSQATRLLHLELVNRFARLFDERAKVAVQELHDMERDHDADAVESAWKRTRKRLHRDGAFYKPEPGQPLDERIGQLISEEHATRDVVNRLRTPSKRECIVRELALWLHKRVADFEDKLDMQPHLLGFDNGVVDLRPTKDGHQHIFRPGLPDDMVSRSVGYDYRAQLPDGDASLGCVDAFWNDTFLDPETREHMQHVSAECLWGANVRQKFVMCVGAAGADGKSVFNSCQTAALGEYACVLPAGALTRPLPPPGQPNPMVVALRGKRYVSQMEMPDKRSLQSDTVKVLTGGDSVTARLPHAATAITFTSQAHLFTFGNKSSAFGSIDGGVKRRLEVVHFETRFVDGEPSPSAPNERRAFREEEMPVPRTEWRMAWMQRLLEYLRRGGLRFDTPLRVRNSAIAVLGFDVTDWPDAWSGEHELADVYAAYRECAAALGSRPAHATQSDFLNALVAAFPGTETGRPSTGSKCKSRKRAARPQIVCIPGGPRNPKR